ncbi:transposase family protein [Streptomyces sp. E11-3]|uniref:transposase family protein n=1 Tax=Streptomyces sp. E11-3 TaxID=3110112 RepID=UPI00397F2E37
MAYPDCGVVSVRVHSRYGRVVADLAVGGRPVEIELSVRRLFCDRLDCGRRTFAEQVKGLTVRYGRRTPQLLEVLRAVRLALGGNEGRGDLIGHHVPQVCGRADEHGDLDWHNDVQPGLEGSHEGPSPQSRVVSANCSSPGDVADIRMRGGRLNRGAGVRPP